VRSCKGVSPPSSYHIQNSSSSNNSNKKDDQDDDDDDDGKKSKECAYHREEEGLAETKVYIPIINLTTLCLSFSHSHYLNFFFNLLINFSPRITFFLFPLRKKQLLIKFLYGREENIVMMIF
jgi:hypothetical protein